MDRRNFLGSLLALPLLPKLLGKASLKIPEQPKIISAKIQGLSLSHLCPSFQSVRIVRCIAGEEFEIGDYVFSCEDGKLYKCMANSRGRIIGQAISPIMEDGMADIRLL